MDFLAQSSVLIILLLFLVVGFLYKKRPTTTQEYALGNVNIKTSTLTATLIATCMGGASIIGYSSTLYQHGIWMFLILLLKPISHCLTSLVVVPRWQKYYGCFSIAQVMECMYGKHVRIVVGVATFMSCMGMLGIQIKSLLWTMEYLFKENALIITIIALFIILTYSSIGGVSSVIKTDVIQWAIFMIILPIIAFHLINISGGITQVIMNLPTNKTSLLPKIGIIELISLMLFYLIPSTNPLIIHRYLIGRNTKKNQATMYGLAATSLVNKIFIACVAFIALAKFPDINPKETIFTVIQNFINNKWAMTAFVIALIAVITSTADSLVNTGSIILVNDIFARKILSEKQKIKLLQLTTIISGIIAMIIAFTFASILDIIWFFSQYRAVIIAVPLIAGLFSTDLYKETFWSSVCLGVVTFTILHLTYSNLGHNKFLISMIISLCTYFITFFIIRKKKFPQWNFSLNKILSAIKVKMPIKIETLGYIILVFYLFSIFFRKRYDLGSIITIDSPLILGILGFSLFFTDTISKKYKDLFILSVIWYCFAFFPAYFFLIQPIKIFTTINLVVSIVILTWLLDRQNFISFLLLGNIIAAITFFINKNKLGVSMIAQIMHLLLFISCIGVVTYILGRKIDNINQRNTTRKTLQNFTKSLTASLNYQNIVLKTNQPTEIYFKNFKNNMFHYFYRLLIQRNIKLKLESNQEKFSLSFLSRNFYKIIYSIIFNILYNVQDNEISVKFYCNENTILDKIEIKQNKIQTTFKNLHSNNIKFYKEILDWNDIHRLLNSLRIKLQTKTETITIYFPSNIKNISKDSSPKEGEII